MPTPTFKRVSIEQFRQILEQFPFTRRINAVHMHHTWKPRRADFKGHETIVSMWRFHTQTNGWRDIAQHVTIDPEGFIWLGRNWNLSPASASGHNGNAAFGPFMFEMVGNFDRNFDPFDGAQKDTALQVVALVQQHFGLATDTLRFHNMMSSKSCPGSAIDYAQTLADVDALKQQGLPAAAPRGRAAALRRFPTTRPSASPRRSRRCRGPCPRATNRAMPNCPIASTTSTSTRPRQRVRAAPARRHRATPACRRRRSRRCVRTSSISGTAGFPAMAKSPRRRPTWTRSSPSTCPRR